MLAKKSKILFYYVLWKVFKKIKNKNEGITHFCSFPLFCEWIAHFAQIKWAMWVNCSFRLPKMSDHEWFAQVPQRKWAIWQITHFAHQTWANEWITHFFEKIAYSLIFGQKTSDSLGNQMREFPALLICSFTQIAQIKWATVSDLLISLKTNERLWANCSCRSYQKRDLLRLLVINERFT